MIDRKWLGCWPLVTPKRKVQKKTNVLAILCIDKLTANGFLCFWHWQRFPIYRENKGSNFSLRHDNAKIRHIIISCLEPQTLASFFQNKQANKLSKQKWTLYKENHFIWGLPNTKTKRRFCLSGFKHQQFFLQISPLKYLEEFYLKTE